MTREFALHAERVAVEVYMADQNPPALHDFYVTRAGEMKRTAIALAIPGIIQVVMAGSSPTSRQILQIRRLFELDERFHLMRFY